jgi:hypothetical protein
LVLLQEANVSTRAVASAEADFRLNKLLIVFIRVFVDFVI